MFDWVSWYRELAQKIAALDPDELALKANDVDWQDRWSLDKFGHDSKLLDPFSFMSVVTAKGIGDEAICKSINEIFELKSETSNLHSSIIPSPYASNLYFFNASHLDKAEPDILWRLFKDAANGIDKVNWDDFGQALLIPMVGIKKLTQSLYLINAKDFLPADDLTVQYQFRSFTEVPPNKNDFKFDTYREIVSEVRDTFQGCELYEFATLAYLQFAKREDLNLQSLLNNRFQIDTEAAGKTEDRWSDFLENSWIYTSEEFPQLQEAREGSVIIARTGQQRGRGIGIVYQNGYRKNGWSEEGKVHVIWLNKADVDLLKPINYDQEFSRINRGRFDDFSEHDSFRKTIDKLNAITPDMGKIKNLSSRRMVLEAIEKYDELGSDKFFQEYAFKRYGFADSTRYDLVHNGKKYPPKAIAGAAYLFQFGEEPPSFGGGRPANNTLRKLGFEIKPKSDSDETEETMIAAKGLESSKFKLNTILYGPPGTGKTWRTTTLAMAILLDKPEDEITDTDRKQIEDCNGQVEFTTFHQNYSYEDFIEGIRPTLKDSELRYELKEGVFKRMAKSAKDDQEQRYVLIIDEINRGNIAKIFGELITLIEDTKRIGAVDQKCAILPYSQERFGVPDNLYIVGTMNTADRSIQILDTALRRRFHFVGMMPDYDIIRSKAVVEGVDCAKMLECMNKRIRLLLSRDKQIGHSYFIAISTIDELANAFQNQIMPLLQEYFYDDWAKIKAVLGGNQFIHEEKVELEELVDMLPSERQSYQLLPFGELAWKNADEYKKIYKKVGSDNDSK